MTAPLLVIHGAGDFIPVDSARAWAAPVPNGRLLVMDGAGHFPYLEVPDRLFPAVETFLSGGWPRDALESGRVGKSAPTPDRASH